MVWSEILYAKIFIIQIAVNLIWFISFPEGLRPSAMIWSGVPCNVLCEHHRLGYHWILLQIHMTLIWREINYSFWETQLKYLGIISPTRAYPKHKSTNKSSRLEFPTKSKVFFDQLLYGGNRPLPLSFNLYACLPYSKLRLVGIACCWSGRSIVA